MKSARSAMLDWLRPCADGGRYQLYWDMLDRLTEPAKFWPRYEEESIQLPAQKRCVAYYLFMAAVQMEVLNEPLEALARYFPASPSYNEHMPVEGLGACFWEFCERRWDVLWNTARCREVQINKLGRNSILAPMLMEAAKRLEGPIAFVEAGASVGMGMLWPHLDVDFGDGRRIEGARSSGEMVLKCKIGGKPSVEVSGQTPDPTSLTGIDTHPLDAEAQDDVRWLYALTAPGDDAGREALQVGLKLVRAIHPTILKGCVLERLPEIEADLPSGQPLVVYHSMTLHHLDAEKLSAWWNLLESLALRRPLIEVAVEWKEPLRTIVEVSMIEWHLAPHSPQLIATTDKSADGTIMEFVAQG